MESVNSNARSGASAPTRPDSLQDTLVGAISTLDVVESTVAAMFEKYLGEVTQTHVKREAASPGIHGQAMEIKARASRILESLQQFENLLA